MSKNASPPKPGGRWLQLWLGVICMALIANLQYAWTLFVDPIHLARGWSLAEIQWAFSLFIATETWLTPVAGAIVDRLGPRSGPSLDHCRGRTARRDRLGHQRLCRVVALALSWVPRYRAQGQGRSTPLASATR